MIFSFGTCGRMRGAHKVTKVIHEVKRTKKCDEEVGGRRRRLVIILAAACQSFDVGYFISCTVINLGLVLIIIIGGMIENMSISGVHHCKYLGIGIEWFGSEILFGFYLGNKNESYI